MGISKIDPHDEVLLSVEKKRFFSSMFAVILKILTDKLET
jgi:hypothetical protein